MIRAEIVKPTEEIKYPWIGVTEERTVVLFEKSKCGVVLYDEHVTGLGVGHHSKGWNMEAFKLFHGSITLKCYGKKYPWIGIAENGEIALFTECGCGFVLFPGQRPLSLRASNSEIGEYATNFAMSCFKPAINQVVKINCTKHLGGYSHIEIEVENDQRNS